MKAAAASVSVYCPHHVPVRSAAVEYTDPLFSAHTGVDRPVVVVIVVVTSVELCAVVAAADAAVG